MLIPSEIYLKIYCDVPFSKGNVCTQYSLFISRHFTNNISNENYLTYFLSVLMKILSCFLSANWRKYCVTYSIDCQRYHELYHWIKSIFLCCQQNSYYYTRPYTKDCQIFWHVILLIYTPEIQFPEYESVNKYAGLYWSPISGAWIYK